MWRPPESGSEPIVGSGFHPVGTNKQPTGPEPIHPRTEGPNRGCEIAGWPAFLRTSLYTARPLQPGTRCCCPSALEGRPSGVCLDPTCQAQNRHAFSTRWPTILLTESPPAISGVQTLFSMLLSMRSRYIDPAGQISLAFSSKQLLSAGRAQPAVAPTCSLALCIRQ
jgi:hypothetical protein